MNKEKEMQATDLQRFIEETSNVCIRAQVINGQPWFVAKDIAAALGLYWDRHTLDTIPDEWKGVFIIHTLSSGKHGGGKQKISVVTDRGVYKMIFKSRKPDADKWMNWIAGDVLPCIMTTGIYAHPSSLLKNGVQGMFYDGKVLYPYLDMLRAIGFSTRSGSVQKRRRNYPQYFVKAFGRNFVMSELVTLLEDERKLIALRDNMRHAQQFLPFKEEEA